MNKNSHIIFSYSFDKNGKPIKIPLNSTSQELKSHHLTWVHLDANNKNTKKWLNQEVSYLDHLIIDALLAEEARPRLIEFENGLLLIMRGIEKLNNSKNQNLASIRLWIDKDRVISIQRRKLEAIDSIYQNIADEKPIKNSGEFLYNLIYQILETTSTFLYSVAERIDILENQINRFKNLKLRDEIIEIRMNLTIFKRYLIPQKEVISKLKNINFPFIDNWAKRHFQENNEKVSHIIEEVDEILSRSKFLVDELSHSLNEKINRNMLKLSLIAMIFMPLTFLASIFGMNFSKIPLTNFENGFYLICFLMIIIGCLQYLFFRIKDWF